MKIDKRILNRFDQLSEKADKILEEKRFDFTADDGTTYHKIDEPAYRAWVTNAFSIIENIFGIDSPQYRMFDTSCNSGNRSAFDQYLEEHRAILMAGKDDYEGGYVFRMESLVRADVLEDVLEQAEFLLESGYKDPACIIAGVLLENALKQLCQHNGIDESKAGKMNDDLCKKDVYNRGMQKQIIAWQDRRNDAAHGRWDQYTGDDVQDMIKGVDRFIAEYL